MKLSERIKTILLGISIIANVLLLVICLRYINRTRELEADIAYGNQVGGTISEFDILAVSDSPIAAKLFEDSKSEEKSTADVVANVAKDELAVYERQDIFANKTKIYLTFDDGPSGVTNELLDILDQYGVKATFFVNYHPEYEDEMKRIVYEGHTIGMHSYSHKYNEIYKDLDSFAEDLYNIQTYVKNVTGVDSRYYRFPGGSSNEVCKMNMHDATDYLNAKGIVFYDWNVSAKDAEGSNISSQAIYNNVIRQIDAIKDDNSTIVVLMHDADNKKSTVKALSDILENLADREDVVILPISDVTTPIQHIY